MSHFAIGVRTVGCRRTIVLGQRRKAIHLMLFLAWLFLLNANTYRAMALPPGYSKPNTSLDLPSYTDHLGFDGLRLREKNRVIFTLNLDYSPLHWADHALKISVGFLEHWTPGDFYLFLPNGYETEPDHAFAFIGTIKIKFPSHFDPEKNQKMRSVNDPRYICYGENQFIVVSKSDDRRWYFKKSASNNSWRLEKIELIKHPGQFTHLIYTNNLVSEIKFPNGYSAKIKYNNNLPSEIATPFGKKVEIARDASGYINSIKIYEQNQYRDKLVKTHRFSRDSEGRLETYQTPSGIQYKCTYDFKITKENDSQKDYYLSIVRRLSDGLYKWRRDELRTNGQWIIQNGSGGHKKNITTDNLTPDYSSWLKAQNRKWTLTQRSKENEETTISYQVNKQGKPVKALQNDGRMIEKKWNKQGLAKEIVCLSTKTRRHLTYNNFGQVTREINYQGEVTTYVYDQNARIIEYIGNNGQIISYDYDDRGFPTKSQIGDITHQFEFDEWGRLSMISDGNCYTNYFYDTQGRVSLQVNTAVRKFSQLPDQTIAYNTTYIYGKHGLKEIQREKANGLIEKQRIWYNDLGNIVQLQRYDKSRERFIYNNDEWLTRIFKGNGSGTVYSYHENGKLKEMKKYVDKKLLNQSSYDARGKIINK